MAIPEWLTAVLSEFIKISLFHNSELKSILKNTVLCFWGENLNIWPHCTEESGR